MRYHPGKKLLLIPALLLISMTATDGVSTAPSPAAPPNPILVYMGQEYYEANGK